MSDAPARRRAHGSSAPLEEPDLPVPAGDDDDSALRLELTPRSVPR
jgi:hypothetical protein